MIWSRVRVSVVCADIAQLIRKFNASCVNIFDLIDKGKLKYEFTVEQKNVRFLIDVLQASGLSYTFLRYDGIKMLFLKGAERAVFIISVILILMLTMILPGKVLFISVVGNERVTAESIIQAAEECGLKFGSDRKMVRSESIKNDLLERIPQLSWLGINTSGCIATIHVRENPTESTADTKGYGGGLYAVTDGVILSYDVTSGTAMITEGQAVKEGQLLVSGYYTDSYNVLHSTRANGEIFAQTSRSSEVIIPAEKCQKEYLGESDASWSLILGKKRINLWNYSGIYHTGCDKMYKEFYVTLPGGYRLPVGIVIETTIYYNLNPVSIDAEQLEALGVESAKQTLLSQLNSGSVLAYSAEVKQLDQYSLVVVRFRCKEMIGRERSEEIEIYYGENN